MAKGGFGGFGGGNMQQLMRQAQKMQQDMEQAQDVYKRQTISYEITLGFTARVPKIYYGEAYDGIEQRGL